MLIKKDWQREQRIISANHSQKKSEAKESFAQPRAIADAKHGQHLLDSQTGTPDNINAYLPPSIFLIRLAVDNVPMSKIYKSNRNPQGYRDYLEQLQKITGQTPAVLAAARKLTSGVQGVHQGIGSQLRAYERGRKAAAAKHNLTVQEYDNVMYPKRFRTDTQYSYINNGIIAV